MEELDVKKTKYFVIAIIILIILGIILIVHFNNNELVNGDVNSETTTTTTTNDMIPITTTTTTTKKKKVKNIQTEVKEEVIVEELDKEEVIYKSTIDEKNNIVYNYKLTNEINNNDKIIATKLNIDSELLDNNVIGLFDISLYDEFMNKKTVSNSLITIKIPIKDELAGYDEYKIVYINDSKITDEEFEVKVIDNYIEFNTTHLSTFGILGIKNLVDEIPNDEPELVIPEDKEDEPELDKEEIIDLSEVDVVLSINGNDFKSNINNTLLLSKSDKLNVKVLNIDYNYEVYYSLNDDEINNYKLFNENILNDIDSTNAYNFKLKIVVKDKFVEFDLGKVSIYDIIYVNNGEETEIGTIYNEDGTNYLYDDKEINKDIVIDDGNHIIGKVIDESISEENSEVIVEETKEERNNNVNDETNNDQNINEDDVTIKVNGNIYLVEETDISNLEMTGYLIIDTSENITLNIYNDKLLLSNLYSITIKSKEFSLNGNRYTYEYDVNDNLVIKKIEDTSADFESLFDNEYQIKKDEANNELIIEKITEKEKTSETANAEETITK